MCSFDSPRWIRRLSFRWPKNDSIEFDVFGTLSYRVYVNKCGIARLICVTLRCSTLCVNHHLFVSSSTLFALIYGSYLQYQSINARSHNWPLSWLSIFSSNRTNSSSSLLASLWGLRVIHVYTSRAICTVHRCITASGHNSRTALRILAPPSQVTLSIQMPVRFILSRSSFNSWNLSPSVSL